MSTLIGSRWLSAASGRLVVQAGPDGLSVENQLGRDLHDLIVWHSGQPYAFKGLARGARARAQAPDPRASSARLAPNKAALVGASARLFDALAGGELGEGRYVARFEWTQQTSALIGEAVLRAAPGVHVIAGVYR